MIQTATETKRTDICFTCALDEMFSGFNTARKVSRSSLVKVRITSMGILNICNLWILLRNISCRTKISSSWTFSLLKLTEVMS